MQEVSVGARIPYSWCPSQQAVLSLQGTFINAADCLWAGEVGWRGGLLATAARIQD